MMPSDFRDRAMAALRYDPESGHFYWKTRSGHAMPGDRAGSLNDNGYWRIGFEGRDIQAHRLAVLFMTGAWPPKGTEPDHGNGKRDDNSWDNLECVTRSRNNLNGGLSRRNNSGVTGVSWDVRRDKWAAEIKVDGVRSRLGRFDTKEQAIAARRIAEDRHGIPQNPHRALPGRPRLR